jgi:type II secretory ATPase GspE/PulE/Tfp pilus assembly ATPase PilB-like protein
MSWNDYSDSNWGAGKRFRLILREQGQAREMGGDDMSIAVQIVDNILMNALDTNSSDIHLQPEREQLRIRFRQDGVLQENGQLPIEQATNVLARLKLASGMRIDEMREPQDGRLDMEYDGRHLSARASCVPCLNGEKFVMRLLDPAAMRVELPRLGMSQELLTKWSRAISAPYGLILVTGPTGSGKTSTLYASLQTLDHSHRNIVTVEDPVEYEFASHVTQVQVSERVGFARVMRSFLRQDPDVMMVGEMRDSESLGIGIQAGLTGHLVLSTLHTNNAIETIGRMVDMGAEPYLIAGVTVGILAQRLVRLNCAKCRAPFQPDPEDLAMLEIPAEVAASTTFYKGKGCNECRGTGYKGRIGVFELMLASPAIKQIIAHGGDMRALSEQAGAEGFATMLDDGRFKVMQGWTTPSEVLKAVFSQAVA